ncbi:MAG: diguanylate cyclase [Phycisphaeraceae bacterium]
MQARKAADQGSGPPLSGEGRRTPDDSQLRARTLEQVGGASVNPAPLLELLRAPANDPDAVTEALSRCPALSARVLSVTNSPAFRVLRPIDTVRRAVIHLGAGRTRSVALAFGLRMLSENSNVPPKMGKALWVASLRKAAAAELACQQIDPAQAEQGYCRALIQDLGLPLLVGLDPDFYERLVLTAGRQDWSKQERRRFGIDHAEVGHYLLGRWGAAEELAETVRVHHVPPTGDDSLRQVPLFLSSLLPHLSEHMTGEQADWMLALYAKFLAPHYASPDAFIEAAADAAAPLHSGGGEEPSREELIVGIAREVSCDVETMVHQLYKLETSLGRQRENLDSLRSQAFTDPLTQVLNRRGFTKLAERRVDDAVRKNLGLCCMMLDLDDFKGINDRLGHDAGDLMLRGLAKLLRRSLDRSDLIGRLGGDEFAVMLVGVSREQAKQVATRLLTNCLGTLVKLDAKTQVRVRLSLGATYRGPDSGEVTLDQIVQAADAAMYRRKRTGKAGLTFEDYVPSDETRLGDLSPEDSRAGQ